MDEQVTTGPLYTGAVQLMGTYRSLAARMGNAKPSTQGKLDHKLEKLGEQISERLGELSDMERLALDCWKDGIMQGTFEVDHQALTEKPYVSIRKVDRVIEELEIDGADSDETADNAYEGATRLKSFISKLNEGL